MQWVRNGYAAVFATAFGNQLYQRSDLHVPSAANAASLDKRPSSLVRDEEVVGSNPATPTV